MFFSDNYNIQSKQYASLSFNSVSQTIKNIIIFIYFYYYFRFYFITNVGGVFYGMYLNITGDFFLYFLYLYCIHWSCREES
jgi:hypothetical protein